MTPLPPDEFDGEDRDDELIEDGEDLLGLTDETEAVEGEEGFADDAEAVEADEGFTDETDVYAHELAEEPPPPATWAGSRGQAEGEPEPTSDELEPVSDEPRPESPSEDLEAPAEVPEPPSEELDPAAQEPGPTDTTPMPAVPAAAGPAVGQPKGLTPAEGGVPPGMVAHPGPEDPFEDDRKPPKAGLWPRFVAAAFVIVISMAAAMSTTGILYITDIAKGLEGLPDVEDRLAKVDGGEPQTILIIGSDKRTGAGAGPGLSDTTMLLRLDDDKSLISLMSLPRDLQVNIPGYGLDKLNAAYSYGGEELTLQTVQELTGLEINHLVNVGFEGFAKAVDAIDCVYIDVDRDYYNSNEGVYGETYAEIDIDPGYQRLCGPDALAYVRFRHEDNDIVRGARQQDFLREARAKVDPGDLFINNRDEYLKIFTDYTTSDIDDAATLIQLLKLFVDLSDAEVQKVEFHGDIGDATSTYVTTSNTQLRIALGKFLGEDSEESGGGGNDSIPAQRPDEQAESGGGDGGDQPADDGGGGSASMIDTSDSAQAYGGEFAKEVNFRVYAPTQLPEGSVYDDDSHAYGVDAPDGATYGGYKLVFSRFGPYGVDEYFGVMGTKWRDPPILDNESETRTIDGRDYLLFYDGGRLRVVGFKTDEAAYWVSNSLTHSLDENEMLGIAQSMTEIEKN